MSKDPDFIYGKSPREWKQPKISDGFPIVLTPSTLSVLLDKKDVGVFDVVGIVRDRSLRRVVRILLSKFFNTFYICCILNGKMGKIHT